MKIRNLNKRGWIALLLVAAVFPGAAFSAGLNVTTWTGNADQGGNVFKVFQINGTTPLTVGSFINIVKGSHAAPNPNNQNLLGAGTSYYIGTVGAQNTGVSAVNNQPGEFDYNFNALIDPQPGQAFVEVWSTSSPAQGAYYNWQTVSLKGPGQSPADLLVSLSTSYKADVPYKPIITKIDETSSTAYPSGTKNASLIVYSAQPNATDGIREITGYSWKISPAPIGNPNTSAANLTLTSDQVLSGETYTFTATHKNWFGEASSDTVSYKIGSGGAGQGGATFAYSLKKSAAGKLVVNNISPPKQIKADALVSAINSAKGSPTVIAIYKWVPAGSTYTAYIPGEKTDDNFSIDAGEGVQVYTTEDVNLQLSN